MTTKQRDPLLASEQGSSILEAVIALPFFLLLLLGAVDFGRGFYLASEVSSAAHAGAIYAVQNYSNFGNDSTGITAAAASDAPDVPGLTVSTPSWGCECSDGTSYSASCSSVPTGCSTNWVYRVTVSTSATYTPLVPWLGIPPSIPLSASATLRAGGN